MNLKSFGCSFIFGSELSDDGRDGPYATPSQLTWPALLSQHLGHQYECHAKPGAGNLQIAEQILIQATGAESALYVVGWTWIDRFDYYPVNPKTPSKSPWRTIMPIDEDAIAKTYYCDIHSEYRDKLTTLMNMRLVIDILKQKGCPFIMTYMDDLTFDTSRHTTPATVELQDYVCPHMTQFEGKSFLEWSRSRGYPETKMWHPLELAHSAAAKYMSELGIYKI